MQIIPTCINIVCSLTTSNMTRHYQCRRKMSALTVIRGGRERGSGRALQQSHQGRGECGLFLPPGRLYPVHSPVIAIYHAISQQICDVQNCYRYGDAPTIGNLTLAAATVMTHTKDHATHHCTPMSKHRTRCN